MHFLISQVLHGMIRITRTTCCCVVDIFIIYIHMIVFDISKVLLGIELGQHNLNMDGARCYGAGVSSQGVCVLPHKGDNSHSFEDLKKVVISFNFRCFYKTKIKYDRTFMSLLVKSISMIITNCLFKYMYQLGLLGKPLCLMLPY